MKALDYWACLRQLRTHRSGGCYSYLERPAIYRVIVVQFLLSLLMALLFLIAGLDAAFSAFVGGLCSAIPNAFLAWKTFHYRGARAARRIVSSFYQGEIGKFFLTVIGFVLAFKYMKPVEPQALFASFILVQSVSWLTPLLIEQRQSKNSNYNN